MGWVLTPATAPPARPGAPSVAPGAREGLETRAAVALEVRQINQSPGDSLSPPPLHRCFWGDSHPEHGVFGSLQSLGHPGVGRTSSQGVGEWLDAPNHLMLQKSTKANPELKGKAKRRCGGEVGTNQGQRRLCLGFEYWFEGMLEGHGPQTSLTCPFPSSLPRGEVGGG